MMHIFCIKFMMIIIFYGMMLKSCNGIFYAYNCIFKEYNAYFLHISFIFLRICAYACIWLQMPVGLFPATEPRGQACSESTVTQCSPRHSGFCSFGKHFSVTASLTNWLESPTNWQYRPGILPTNSILCKSGWSPAEPGPPSSSTLSSWLSQSKMLS